MYHIIPLKTSEEKYPMNIDAINSFLMSYSIQSADCSYANVRLFIIDCFLTFEYKVLDDL